MVWWVPEALTRFHIIAQQLQIESLEDFGISCSESAVYIHARRLGSV
jgi:hypothetical protein